ncbi:hypothetical protein CAOG_06527 [Capsaspora owczarzaki ATCC 30864]|uniref:C2H2-type domain-containing protein n=1 Tax=Capsaspora owczarzaki (strain ATCC 30864) TaxID=595528 RepID=A0A0D2X4J4_CAPO3|nr:hypothetical protein CAOG_06527 [Capsaspora owczarzaki ATCC 30864]KJE96164.1 hypothetical protein CAOG_006527 [Capsaspora owczarzaki ATCC 30864]|eukprot:XP_004345276.1 hypothetical protein CAOG_06527 [Capsaspora owczarzaki ATCC 30864]
MADTLHIQEGFICPACMTRFDAADRLRLHYRQEHSAGEHDRHHSSNNHNAGQNNQNGEAGFGGNGGFGGNASGSLRSTLVLPDQPATPPVNGGAGIQLNTDSSNGGGGGDPPALSHVEIQGYNPTGSPDALLAYVLAAIADGLSCGQRTPLILAQSPSARQGDPVAAAVSAAAAAAAGGVGLSRAGAAQPQPKALHKLLAHIPPSILPAGIHMPHIHVTPFLPSTATTAAGAAGTASSLSASTPSIGSGANTDNTPASSSDQVRQETLRYCMHAHLREVFGLTEKTFARALETLVLERKLEVTVHGAKNLLPKDRDTCNPFATVQVGADVQQTASVPHSCNPTFTNSTFTFEICQMGRRAIVSAETLAEASAGSSLSGASPLPEVLVQLWTRTPREIKFLGQTTLATDRDLIGDGCFVERTATLEKRTARSHVSGTVHVSAEFLVTPRTDSWSELLAAGGVSSGAKTTAAPASSAAAPTRAIRMSQSSKSCVRRFTSKAMLSMYAQFLDAVVRYEVTQKSAFNANASTSTLATCMTEPSVFALGGALEVYSRFWRGSALVALDYASAPATSKGALDAHGFPRYLVSCLLLERFCNVHGISPLDAQAVLLDRVARHFAATSAVDFGFLRLGLANLFIHLDGMTDQQQVLRGASSTPNLSSVVPLDLPDVVVDPDRPSASSPTHLAPDAGASAKKGTPSSSSKGLLSAFKFSKSTSHMHDVGLDDPDTSSLEPLPSPGAKNTSHVEEAASSPRSLSLAPSALGLSPSSSRSSSVANNPHLPLAIRHDSGAFMQPFELSSSGRVWLHSALSLLGQLLENCLNHYTLMFPDAAAMHALRDALEAFVTSNQLLLRLGKLPAQDGFSPILALGSCVMKCKQHAWNLWQMNVSINAPPRSPTTPSSPGEPLHPPTPTARYDMLSRAAALGELVYNELDADDKLYAPLFAEYKVPLQRIASALLCELHAETVHELAAAAPSLPDDISQASLLYTTIQRLQDYVRRHEEAVGGWRAFYPAWFKWLDPPVKLWLRQARAKISEWVTAALLHDRLLPITNDQVLYSSSVVDIFSCLNETISALLSLEWPDNLLQHTILPEMGTTVLEETRKLAVWLCQPFAASTKGPAGGKSAAGLPMVGDTPTPGSVLQLEHLCVALNDIAQSFQEMHGIATLLGVHIDASFFQRAKVPPESRRGRMFTTIRSKRSANAFLDGLRAKAAGNASTTDGSVISENPSTNNSVEPSDDARTSSANRGGASSNTTQDRTALLEESASSLSHLHLENVMRRTLEALNDALDVLCAIIASTVTPTLSAFVNYLCGRGKKPVFTAAIEDLRRGGVAAAAAAVAASQAQLQAAAKINQAGGNAKGASSANSTAVEKKLVASFGSLIKSLGPTSPSAAKLTAAVASRRDLLRKVLRLRLLPAGTGDSDQPRPTALSGRMHPNALFVWNKRNGPRWRERRRAQIAASHQGVLDELIDWLDTELELLSSHLYRDVLLHFVRDTWYAVLNATEEAMVTTAASAVRDRMDCTQLAALSAALATLHDFFFAEGDGLSLSSLDKEEYHALQNAFLLSQQPTADLLDVYYELRSQTSSLVPLVMICEPESLLPSPRISAHARRVAPAELSNGHHKNAALLSAAMVTEDDHDDPFGHPTVTDDDDAAEDGHPAAVPAAATAVVVSRLDSQSVDHAHDTTSIATIASIELSFLDWQDLPPEELSALLLQPVASAPRDDGKPVLLSSVVADAPPEPVTGTGLRMRSESVLNFRPIIETALQLGQCVVRYSTFVEAKSRTLSVVVHSVEGLGGGGASLGCAAAAAPESVRPSSPRPSSPRPISPRPSSPVPQSEHTTAASGASSTQQQQQQQQIRGTIDAVVTVELILNHTPLAPRHKTTVKSKVSATSYEELFTFTLPPGALLLGELADNAVKPMLRLSIWNHHTFTANELLGECMVSLTQPMLVPARSLEHADGVFMHEVDQCRMILKVLSLRANDKEADEFIKPRVRMLASVADAAVGAETPAAVREKLAASAAAAAAKVAPMVDIAAARKRQARRFKQSQRHFHTVLRNRFALSDVATSGGFPSSESVK